MIKFNHTYVFPIFCIAIYSILFLFSIDFCYFWDNIQQTSKEAHFFLTTNFETFPTNKLNSEFSFTGYHPPLMGLLTAILWKVFDYSLWVSHAFIFIWAIFLIYNLHKVLGHFFNEKQAGWILMILLFEPTVMSQFVIASPDFILLTAFVVSIRAVLENKRILLSVGLFFLFGVNMRGVFAGFVFIIAHFVFIYTKNKQKVTFEILFKNFISYAPVFTILGTYYIVYLSINGWFFSNSPYSEHYALPTNLNRIIVHFFEFAVRTLENGRFLMWSIFIYSLYSMIKKHKLRDSKFIFMILLVAGLFSIYFLFIFITQMPFSPRYFMPIFLLLSIIALYGIVGKIRIKQTISLFILILIVEISGNLWIYPDKIAKSWDTTLAHTSYYSLRKECFDYIDANKINYNDISAGFCLYGNRKVVELNNIETKISSEPNRKYFIFSNISNVDDKFALELMNKSKWKEIKRFEKLYVYISIFKRV